MKQGFRMQVRLITGYKWCLSLPFNPYFISLLSSKDNFHKLRLCESVLFRWKNLARCSHDITYTAVMRMMILYSKGRILSKWKERFLLCRMQSIHLESMATKLGKLNKLKWVMRKFKLGIRKAIRDSISI